ncbi:MAG: glycoside hydrolase family 2 TIM barrel-domain containing protein [Rikenellaceae bacterium]
MRIIYSIITFIALATSISRGYCQEPLVSLNVEPYRSSVVPYSTALGSANQDVTSVRYALSLDQWERDEKLGNLSFNTFFEVPFSWTGRQAILSIETASSPYIVYVGGEEVGRTLNGTMPAQFNITRYLEREASSPITIELIEGSSSEELEGWSKEAKSFLGRVMVLSQPSMYVRDVSVTSAYSYGMINSTVAIAVKSTALLERVSRINYELISPVGRVATSGSLDVTLDMRREDTLRFFVVTPDSMAWSAATPNLYKLKLSTQYRGRHLEHLAFDLGLRSVECSDSGELIVNGSSVALKAAEIEPTTTNMRVAELKSRGYNALMISAGTYNPELFRFADSVGLYVVATAPINSSKSGDNTLVGGNPTNNPERTAEYIERVDAIYHTTKLHPSVIAYSLADSSLNGINLYESYLYLKSRENQRPIIYEDNQGEWNSDRLNIEY